MRFLVATVTPYSTPVFTGVGNTYPTMFASTSANEYAQTYVVDQAAADETFAA